MPDGALHVRPALQADAHAIALINVGCWQDAYAHILDPAILAQRSVDDAAARWWTYLSQGDGDLDVLVAEEAGRIVGFGSCGSQRDETLRADGYSGEITALYVRTSEQRRGIGNALLHALAALLTDAGHGGVSLWVLADNRNARNFYEGAGGQCLPRSRQESRLGDVTQLAYGWRDFDGAAARISLSSPILSVPYQGERP